MAIASSSSSSSSSAPTALRPEMLRCPRELMRLEEIQYSIAEKTSIRMPSAVKITEEMRCAARARPLSFSGTAVGPIDMDGIDALGVAVALGVALGVDPEGVTAAAVAGATSTWKKKNTSVLLPSANWPVMRWNPAFANVAWKRKSGPKRSLGIIIERCSTLLQSGTAGMLGMWVCMSRMELPSKPCAWVNELMRSPMIPTCAAAPRNGIRSSRALPVTPSNTSTRKTLHSRATRFPGLSLVILILNEPAVPALTLTSGTRSLTAKVLKPITWHSWVIDAGSLPRGVQGPHPWGPVCAARMVPSASIGGTIWIALSAGIGGITELDMWVLMCLASARSHPSPSSSAQSKKNPCLPCAGNLNGNVLQRS
eukprot:comp20728_c0_seq1/m.42571 comp20728_c0_seq1/g.42571  ORF comp20728_c0_seq1/g.42571 comp20728_c0_seq1/m.42571 type:complete len:368 (-) comp20728_c0_seq1:299-1402(-)